MDREKLAEELTAIAKTLVYDADRYMKWAQEDLEPMALMIHSLKARAKDAHGTTMDKKAHNEIKKVEKDIAAFEKAYQKLDKTLKSFKPW